LSIRAVYTENIDFFGKKAFCVKSSVKISVKMLKIRFIYDILRVVFVFARFLRQITLKENFYTERN